jgi:MFS family permease
MQTIGSVVALPIVPFVADRYGRRLPVFAGSVFALLGTALQTASSSIDMFNAGRFFVGFGTGLVGVASAPLVAELAYPTHRPFLTSFASTTWVLCIVPLFKSFAYETSSSSARS